MANIASTLPLIQTAVQQNPLSLDSGGSDSIFSSILDDTLFPTAKQIAPNSVTVLGKPVVSDDSEPLSQKTESSFWDIIEGAGDDTELEEFPPGRNIDRVVFADKKTPTETVAKNVNSQNQTPERGESQYTDVARENLLHQATDSQNNIQYLPASGFIETSTENLKEKTPLQANVEIISNKQVAGKTDQLSDYNKLNDLVRTPGDKWNAISNGKNRPNGINLENQEVNSVKTASTEAAPPTSAKQSDSKASPGINISTIPTEKNVTLPSTGNTKVQTAIAEQVSKLIQNNETAQVKVTDITSNVKSYERLTSLTLTRDNNLTERANTGRHGSPQHVTENPHAAKVTTEPGIGEISGKRSEVAIDVRSSSQPPAAQATNANNSFSRTENQNVPNSSLSAEPTGEEQTTFKREVELTQTKSDNGSRGSLEKNHISHKHVPLTQEIDRNNIERKTASSARPIVATMQSSGISRQSGPVVPDEQTGKQTNPVLQAEVAQNRKQTNHVIDVGRTPENPPITTKQPLSNSYSQKVPSDVQNLDSRQQTTVEPNQTTASSAENRTENSTVNNRSAAAPSAAILQRPLVQDMPRVNSTTFSDKNPELNAQSQVATNQVVTNSKAEKNQTFSDKILDKILEQTSRPARNVVKESAAQANQQNNNGSTQQQQSGQLEQQGSHLANSSPIVQNEQTTTFQSVTQTVHASTAQQTTSTAASSATTSSSMMPEQLENSILNQVAEKVQLQTRNRETHLHLRLRPAELGELQIRLSIKSGALKAHIFAQSGKVQDVLEKNMPRLKEMLESQGMKIEEFVVSSQKKSVDSFDFFENQTSADDTEQEASQQNSLETESTDNFESLLTEAVDPDSGINVKA